MNTRSVNPTIDRLDRRANRNKRAYAVALGVSLLVLLALMYATSVAVTRAPLGL